MPPAGDGCKKPPHPALRAALSREGRGLLRADVRYAPTTDKTMPSPLAGEGGRRRRPGEGASAHRSCRGIPVFEENRTERENRIQRPAEWKRAGVGETACAQIET